MTPVRSSVQKEPEGEHRKNAARSGEPSNRGADSGRRGGGMIEVHRIAERRGMEKKPVRGPHRIHVHIDTSRM